MEKIKTDIEKKEKRCPQITLITLITLIFFNLCKSV